MKCVGVQLYDRKSAQRRALKQNSQKEGPKRYCQQKMINPNHEENPRWANGALERFLCERDTERPTPQPTDDSSRDDFNDVNDLFLTVLNLNLPKDASKPNNTRSCIKYKMLSGDTNHNSHRMFVKQVVENTDLNSYDIASAQGNYKIDDYVKDILNGNDYSRPSTGISGYIYHDAVIDHKLVNDTKDELPKSKPKVTSKKIKQPEITKEISAVDDDTTVKYQSIGKRRSLTISRAQSPETVQVIRVDVVCNYSSRSSIISDLADCIKEPNPASTASDEISTKNGISKTSNQLKGKYFLTNSIKQLDEHIGGGEKVTLLCKTFKLSKRTKKGLEKVNVRMPNRSENNKHNKTSKRAMQDF